MSQFATVPAVAPLLPAKPLDLPQSVAWAVHEAQAAYGEPMSPDTARSARIALDRVEARCCPASSQAILEWLKPVAAGVRNPLGREDFLARASVIASVVADLPHGVFTRETLHDGLATWHFFPSAAEVHALLHAKAAPLLAQRAGLRLALARPQSQPSDTMTPEQRSAAADTMAAMVKEMRGNTVTREPLRAKPAFLTPEQLAVIRRQQGIGAVAARMA